MPHAFTRAYSTPTPQSEPENDQQVKNNAGGYTFTVSAKGRLERFLILGTDGGTYYVKERNLTQQNFDFLVKLINDDELMVNAVIRDVSTNGRAYKNSPAIFATALLFKHGKDKEMARSTMLAVCRTSTHLFEFAEYIELIGGWGRAKRSAVADWYTGKSAEQLAYQVVKYRQRNGWTHRDLFRLSHPVGVDASLGNFILQKNGFSGDSVPSIVMGFTEAQNAATVAELTRILDENKNLPWEAIPTQYLKSPDVWKKLFYNGQLNGQALVRNITRLARINAFDDMVFAGDYATRLTDEEMIRKTRLHPINYLNALTVHTEGQIGRNNPYSFYASRSKDWTTVPVIVDALNQGFHLSFKHVEPSNKRTLLALDVSGSMSQNANGLDLSCAQVCAAMAMTTARTEPYYNIRGFSTVLKELRITPNMGLSQTMAVINDQNFGGTDCSLPMTWALRNKVEVDTFQIYTDNETWAGYSHPHVALREYRQKMGIEAKLVVVGAAATEFSIADPQDGGMLDVAGFDANAPKVIADFSANRF